MNEKNTAYDPYAAMTDEELRRKAKRCGSSYNPYRVELDDREFAALKSEPRTRYHILREIATIDCAAARESGTYDADRIAELESQLEEIDE